MKKKIFVCLLTACLLVGLAACGATKEFAENREDVQNEYAFSEDNDGVSGGNVSSQRKVVVTAGYTVQTQKFSESVQKLETLVKELGGYIEHSNVSGESSDNGSGDFTLRLPVNKLDGFGQALTQVGTVESHSRSEEDITNQYYDTDARIKAKTAQRDRLLALIDKAENLDTLLRLESELADVQGELDSLTGQLKRYDNQVSYAMVQVSLYQSALTRSGNIPYGSRLSAAFTGTFSTALEILKDIGVAAVWLLPLLLVAAIVLLIVWLATRKQRRLRKEMRQQSRSAYVPPQTPPADKQP